MSWQPFSTLFQESPNPTNFTFDLFLDARIESIRA